MPSGPAGPTLPRFAGPGSQSTMVGPALIVSELSGLNAESQKYPKRKQLALVAPACSASAVHVSAVKSPAISSFTETNVTSLHPVHCSGPLKTAIFAGGVFKKKADAGPRMLFVEWRLE